MLLNLEVLLFFTRILVLKWNGNLLIVWPLKFYDSIPSPMELMSIFGWAIIETFFTRKKATNFQHHYKVYLKFQRRFYTFEITFDAL